MAWIEDPDRRVLLVHQAGGLELWTLPGGKVKRGESLVKALPTAESPLGALVFRGWEWVGIAHWR